jgi:hypothetical protein
VGANEDILYALSKDASSIEEFKRPIIRGPGYMRGYMRSCNPQKLSERSLNRPGHRLYVESRSHQTIYQASPQKLARCACASTPRGELRYSHLVKLPRTPTLPSIAVLSGADLSFPSCSPLAPIKPRRTRSVIPYTGWLSLCSVISDARLRPGALPLLLYRKNDVMMTILRVSQYPSVHFSVRFLLLRER